MKLREKLIGPIAVGVLALGILACAGDTSPRTINAEAEITLLRQQAQAAVGQIVALGLIAKLQPSFKAIHHGVNAYRRRTEHWINI